MAQNDTCQTYKPCTPAASCAEAKAQNPDLVDGYVELTLNIDAIDFDQPRINTKWPWGRSIAHKHIVYCHNMGSNEPTAFLDVNATSRWAIGNSTFVTSFTRARFDETTQMIYTADYTFASVENDSAVNPCDPSSECHFTDDSIQKEMNCLNDNTFVAPIGSSSHWWNPGQCTFMEGSGCPHPEATKYNKSMRFDIQFKNGATAKDVHVWRFLRRPIRNQFVQHEKTGGANFSVERYSQIFSNGCDDATGVMSKEVVNIFEPIEIEGFGQKMIDICADDYNITEHQLRTIYNSKKLMNANKEDIETIVRKNAIDDESKWYKAYCELSSALKFEERPNGSSFPFNNKSMEYLGAGGWAMPICFDTKSPYKPINCIHEEWYNDQKLVEMRGYNYDIFLKYAGRELPEFKFGKKEPQHNTTSSCPQQIPCPTPPPLKENSAAHTAQAHILASWFVLVALPFF